MSFAAVIVGGAALVGSVVSSRASSRAASQQVKSADTATAEQRRQYDQNRADMLPYQQTGTRALSQLAREMGIGGPQAGPLSYEEWAQQSTPAGVGGGGPVTLDNATGRIIGRVVGNGAGQIPAAGGDRRGEYEQYVQGFASNAPDTSRDGYLSHDFTLADFEKDPGYQFRLDEGQKALEHSAAARGGLLSGGTGKALQRYGQDYASGEYSNAYSRFNNDRTTRFNRLSSLAGTGQQAAQTLGQFGSNTANNISDLATQRGNARAAGTIGSGNAVSGGVQSLADFYVQQQYLKKLPGYGGGSGGGWGISAAGAGG